MPYEMSWQNCLHECSTDGIGRKNGKEPAAVEATEERRGQVRRRRRVEYAEERVVVVSRGAEGAPPSPSWEWAKSV